MFGVPVIVMKSMLTQKEFFGWVKYFNTREPDAQEIQMAVLSNIVSGALGGKSKIEDFLIHKTHKSQDSLRPMSAKEVAGVFAGVAKKMV